MQRLEEAVGFAEHTNAQLHEQVLALANDLRAAQKKLAAIERRLDEAAASQDSGRPEPGFPSHTANTDDSGQQ